MAKIHFKGQDIISNFDSGENCFSFLFFKDLYYLYLIIS